ncbi:MAG: nicotinate-nucleotide adenylyltransferase [Pseudomonadales bacterium]|jgi:nicotinate-nucleotide adenylyltransferase
MDTPEARKLIAVYGGTFNPIHQGHVQAAEEISVLCGTDSLILVPASIPPHRAAPSVTFAHRLRMVELAIAGREGWRVDDREERRDAPSYTIDTLASLRDELGPDVSLAFCLGSDAFQSINTWHRWEELTDFAHVIVAQRCDMIAPLNSIVEKWSASKVLSAPSQLRDRPSGGVLHLSQRPMNCSSSDIRAKLAQGASPNLLLPESVLQYIKQQHLYQTE